MLRKKFEGKPEYLINYLFLLAEEVRGYMAKMGFRTFQDMVGRSDMLKTNMDKGNPKACLLDFANVLKNAQEMNPDASILGGSLKQNFELEQRLVRTSTLGLKKLIPVTVRKNIG